MTGEDKFGEGSRIDQGQIELMMKCETNGYVRNGVNKKYKKKEEVQVHSNKTHDLKEG